MLTLLSGCFECSLALLCGLRPVRHTKSRILGMLLQRRPRIVSRSLHQKRSHYSTARSILRSTDNTTQGDPAIFFLVLIPFMS